MYLICTQHEIKKNVWQNDDVCVRKRKNLWWDEREREKTSQSLEEPFGEYMATALRSVKEQMNVICASAHNR